MQTPSRFPPNPWLTLSLTIATLLTAWPQPHDGSLAFLVLAATTFLSLRFRIGPLALIILLVVGVELRYAQFGVGVSDVATVIRNGIDQVAHGINPYIPSTVPGQAPFPYGPLTLLWYAPLHDPRLQEFGVSILLLTLLAMRGNPMGLALWATAPGFVQFASDGSSDHTVALFLLLALVVLERAPRAGAVLLGIGAGFKIYVLAWVPPILVWAGAGAFAAGLVAALAVWLPAVLLWGPGNILATFQAADAVHRTAYYSLGEALSRAHFAIPRPTLDLFRLIAGAVTALIVSPMARTFRGVVVAGMAIYFVTLYAGYWSSPAYLLPPLLVVCWYIDAWLGPVAARIKWPSDPIGLIGAEVDRRWPVIDATRIGRQ